MKKMAALLLAMMLISSLGVASYATSPNVDLAVTREQQEITPRSFSRSFEAEVSADRWTLVGYDINILADRRLEIELDEAGGYEIVFRIRDTQDKVPTYVYMEEGESKVITLPTDYPFMIDAQINGNISAKTTISGYFNLAKS